MEEIYNEFSKIIDKNRIHLNEPMSKHTTFKIGGPAELFIKVQNIEELKHIINVCNKENIPLTVIGNGSNVLVKDEGIKGVTIKLEFKEYKYINDNTIEVGSGMLLSRLSNLVCEKGLTGMEFACGIPGTVGGATRMNAGAHGKEMKDIIVSTTYIDKECKICKINNPENKFGNRTSLFSMNKEYIIVSVEIKLEKGSKDNIKNKINENLKFRKEKQPINLPSAGSIFKRGENFFAAKLIDECGLKGYKIGDAEVSKKHAGFIINNGNATARDVLELIEYIKQKVYKKFNIQIEMEVEILG